MWGQGKKEEIWHSPMTKARTPIENSKKQSANTKTPSKTLITHQLRTDVGQSDGAKSETQLTWLKRLTVSHSSLLPQQKCNRGRDYKDTILQLADSWIHKDSKETRSSGGVVVKLLACGARGPGFHSRSHRYDFTKWSFPASKSRYSWKIAKATLILKTTNQQPKKIIIKRYK